MLNSLSTPKRLSVVFKPRNRQVGRWKLAVFLRSFDLLFRAGIQVVDCLEALAREEDSAEFKEALEHMTVRLVHGAPLSRAMVDQGPVFPARLCALVRLGEETGGLANVLSTAAVDFEKEAAIEKKLQSASVYPALLSVFALFCLAGLLFFFVPMMLDFTSSLRMELSPLFSFLLWVLEVVTNPWIVFVSAQIALALAALFFFWGRSVEGEETLHRIALSLPLFGPLLRIVATIRLSRSLAGLLRCGCPLTRALKLMPAVLGNRVLMNEIEATRDSIMESGMDLAESLKLNTGYGPDVIGLIASGEQSGKLEKVLDTLAAGYEMRMETRIESMLALLEPFILSVLGAAVAAVSLFFFLPMSQLIGNL